MVTDNLCVQVVELSPLEAGPKPGLPLVIEVRIAAGWNYYIEYRKNDSSQFYDNQPSRDNVIITDVMYAHSGLGSDRPPIIFPFKDEDFDGPVLSPGKDFKQIDETNWPRATNFRVACESIDASSKTAKVRIQYGNADDPDPRINIWPMTGPHAWQSPDITVYNSLNCVDINATFPVPDPNLEALNNSKNVPELKTRNRVKATITNNGAVCDRPVYVFFYYQQFTAGAFGNKFKFGQDFNWISKDSQADFYADWWPSTDGHWCITVEIQQYKSYPRSDGKEHNEVTTGNNTAQSNYWTFNKPKASPGVREIYEVLVVNPLPLEACIGFDIGQSNPLYRSYLSARSVRLPAGASQPITVMHEMDPSNLEKVPTRLGSRVPPIMVPIPGGNKDTEAQAKALEEEFKDLTNEFSLAAWAVPSDPVPGGSQRLPASILLGGLQTSMITGDKTQFESFGVRGDLTTGRIVDKNGIGVKGGMVRLNYWRSEEKQGQGTVIADATYPIVEVDDDGKFQHDWTGDEGVRTVRPNFILGTYCPITGLAACESSIVQISIDGPRE